MKKEDYQIKVVGMDRVVECTDNIKFNYILNRINNFEKYPILLCLGKMDTCSRSLGSKTPRPSKKSSGRITYIRQIYPKSVLELRLVSLGSKVAQSHKWRIWFKLN